jgi:hypothetical protein
VDTRQFDELTIAVAGRIGNRRFLLRGFGAAVVASLGLAGSAGYDQVAAKGCFVKGRRCQRHGQCCSGTCRRGACASCG